MLAAPSVDLSRSVDSLHAVGRSIACIRCNLLAAHVVPELSPYRISVGRLRPRSVESASLLDASSLRRCCPPGPIMTASGISIGSDSGDSGSCGQDNWSAFATG